MDSKENSKPESEDGRKKPRTPAQIEAFEKAVEAKAAKKAGKGKPVDWSLYKAPAEDGCSEQLRLYRHVMLNPAEYDRTHAEQAIRKIFVSGPTRFGDVYDSLEREHRKALERLANREMEAAVAAGTVPAGVLAPVPVRDMGSERVEELIAELFSRFEAEEAKR